MINVFGNIYTAELLQKIAAYGIVSKVGSKVYEFDLLPICLSLLMSSNELFRIEYIDFYFKNQNDIDKMDDEVSEFYSEQFRTEALTANTTKEHVLDRYDDLFAENYYNLDAEVSFKNEQEVSQYLYMKHLYDMTYCKRIILGNIKFARTWSVTTMHFIYK